MRIILLATLLAVLLAACQSATTPTVQTTLASAAPVAAGAPATEAARAAVRQYLRAQPDSALYVLDSAAILDADANWQVLVPRTDWANRMPNKAAFDVNKATGTVTRRAVK